VSAGAFLALAALYLTRRSHQDEALAQEPGAGSFYPLTPAWKAMIVLFGGALFLANVIAAWQFGVIAVETRDTTQGLLLAFFLAVLAASLGFYVIDSLLTAVVLRADRLEVHELWRMRSILRTDIETRQVLHPPNSPPLLVLRLKAPGNRKVKLPVMWNTDPEWDTWFAAIPDVDAEAAKAFEAAIETNSDLGSTPAERQDQLARARTLARNATWINLGLVTWAFFYPHPYELLIIVLALLPWAAIWIMARSPGLYTLNAPRDSGRPDLTVLLISPGFLLTLRALIDVQILDWHRLLACAVLVAMALAAAVVWAVPSVREKLGAALLTLALLIAYGYGACALVNAILDHSSGSIHATAVYGKHVSGGRSRTPTLRLAPWGPRTTAEDVTVSWDVYRATSVGDKVCVRLRPGALGIPWYAIAKCQPKG
jgi:hypothetical protein